MSITKKTKIKELLRLVDEELRLYKETGNEVWLYQVSEKLWTAYIIHIEDIEGRDLQSRKEIDVTSWKLIKQKKINRKMYDVANTLHIYHYEGRLSTRLVLSKINYLKKRLN